ncbi:peptidase domain-containing ABC transporter [Roseobacter sinensis]|uniref:Peptidase domain-containing ABC transporter n=1 Tax=Roseobacter sinensis TaxID=2931391 RepID=A0ABT3BEP8_9RHOB|nr:peptidase domain-containing ABC transporter [Roseobacter sp. WL0113]MCV3272030.1 peptidase domain-containing ABC transporter [Roseobacter sp. WL0113]
MTEQSRDAAETAQPRMVPLSWFGQTLWKFTPLYVELVFLAICIRLLGLVEPFIFQVIIDRILPFQREATLIVVMAVFAAVSVFHIGFNILSSLLGMLTANRVTRELGSRIFEHLFRLPYSHFRKWPVGETIARVSETDTIRAFLVGTTTGVVLDLLFVVIYLGVLYTLSPLLTAIVVASLPLQAFVYFIFGPFLRRRLRVQFDAGARHQSRMVESIGGIASVKALSAEDKMLGGLRETLGDTLDAGLRVGKLRIASSNLIYAVSQTLTILIIFIGAREVFAGALTLGQLIAFHLIAEKVASPISNFSGLWEKWQNIKISRQRLGDILLSEPEAFEALPRLPADVEPELRFEQVDFAYQPGTPILTEFSFTAKARSLSLVIGPSGIGKSTFGRLASGIEAPTGGRITLDGHDISEHEPHDVRTRIAYVPQEPYLFSGTVRENLSLNVGADVSEAVIADALRTAAADAMVARLPLGLDTQVGERGAALSGGQRQRIAMARSLLNAPRVLILDEPTSALDGAAQAQMVAEIERLKATMTVIVITHRPDVFATPDQVIDFEALR